MDFYDYDRRQIAVTADGGTKQTHAFLYLHQETKERDYTARQQSSLPRVPSDIARDLSDSVPAGPVSILPLPVHSHSGLGRRQKQRRDGAFAVPRSLIVQLGWTTGVSLGLTVDAGQMRLTPDGTIPMQVWSGLRVRICKRKLELGALIADQVTVGIDGGGLTLMART